MSAMQIQSFCLKRPNFSNISQIYSRYFSDCLQGGSNKAQKPKVHPGFVLQTLYTKHKGAVSHKAAFSESQYQETFATSAEKYRYIHACLVGDKEQNLFSL